MPDNKRAENIDKIVALCKEAGATLRDDEVYNSSKYDELWEERLRLGIDPEKAVSTIRQLLDSYRSVSLHMMELSDRVEERDEEICSLKEEIKELKWRLDYITEITEKPTVAKAILKALIKEHPSNK